MLGMQVQTLKIDLTLLALTYSINTDKGTLLKFGLTFNSGF